MCVNVCIYYNGLHNFLIMTITTTISVCKNDWLIMSFEEEECHFILNNVANAVNVNAVSFICCLSLSVF